MNMESTFKDVINEIKKQSILTTFNAVKITLVSPEQILMRSYGEIRKPETINYRTFKPEKDGLFCAKIFGPIKDFECLCGKYKKLKHRGIVCEKCNVEVISSKVRRVRMANITLVAPVAHIWFLKSSPSKIGLVLNLSIKDVERVLYFERYIVTENNIAPALIGRVLKEDECAKLLRQYGDEIEIQTGAEALQSLLRGLDLNDIADEIRRQISYTSSEIKKKLYIKRLKIIESFISSNNKPEWMIFNVLPVLPPDLRPLVPLDGGRFASSDLNDLYRRIINRNNRLRRLMDLFAPDIIVRNEKRMLQEAVDSLFDNGKRGKVIIGMNKRPLKSLADMIKGKYGRFRQNLLGKRVDYSGRSVIVSGPKLKLYQCGLPKNLAFELFKPLLLGELRRKDISLTVKSSKKFLDGGGKVIWRILEEIIYQHPVLLNRAPTLHRLGIQAFEPILVEGKAIQLHPLVCTAFNADFDGDQMAVHVPLTIEAQIESRVLMLSINNVLSPASGDPIITPTQDIVLGIYYLSQMKYSENDNVSYFKDEYDLEKAYENNVLDLHTKVRVLVDSKYINITFGRILLFRVLPYGLDIGLVNKKMKKKDISFLLSYCYKKFGIEKVVILADKLMRLGFEYATKSGMSIGIDDMCVPDEKGSIIFDTQKQVQYIEESYINGLVTKEERYNKIIDSWSKANDLITELTKKKFLIRDSDDEGVEVYSLNPIYVMADSGARGSMAQIRQLVGMRGLMAKPDGSIIETPIIASFKEGLDVLQYFISAHGARKGLADTALKTANSGYLTRRLVDVAQDLVVTKFDCFTSDGILITPAVDSENTLENIKDRIFGRVLQEDLYNSCGNILLRKGVLLDDYSLEIIEKNEIEEVKVRSVVKCELRYGVCAMCYGADLTTGCFVSVGEAVGVIAAQSIGEPGTQLTMRTFHIGGVASRAGLSSYSQANINGKLEYQNIKTIVHGITGDLMSISRTGKVLVFDNKGRERERHRIPYGSILKVNNGKNINKGDVIALWDPHNTSVISEVEGIAQYCNLIENITIKKEIDYITNVVNIMVIEPPKHTKLPNNSKPCIKILDFNNISITQYLLLPGTIINIKDGEHINVGDVIAKIPKGTSKVKDITGGLPKVADIFEARKPKNAAVLAEMSGLVSFGKETRGKNKIIISNDDKTVELLIPKWKSLNIFEGEFVMKGDMIVEGDLNLHDVLRLLGVDKVTEHIRREVQDIYKSQGVKINDKHIEVIVKQMLRKAVVIDAGDSDLLKYDQEDISKIKNINDELFINYKKEILYEQILLGITKAALTTESFISAASFQETARVLTDAAICGKRDKLIGLKENVIAGKLIPAGTGFNLIYD